jgi:hypothetical protein
MADVPAYAVEVKVRALERIRMKFQEIHRSCSSVASYRDDYVRLLPEMIGFHSKEVIA